MSDTKKLNEEFIIDEQTKKLPSEEKAPLGSWWGGEGSVFRAAPDYQEKYSYRIINLERDYEAEETLCKYGSEGFRIVYTMGYLIIMEREE